MKSGTLRFYISAGAFLRLILSRDYFGIEPVAPLGFQPGIGVEVLKTGPSAKIFIEYIPSFYFGENSRKLAQTLSGKNDIPYVSEDWYFFEPLGFRIGLRMNIGEKGK